ncbi:MAG: transcription antitermination factor NusB [Elusimicrobiales bacterium]|nr:transcription antitermination factor NusB [Elusimicrobiales bacterium]HPO94430.1 transcription antitermination factor NusB [Elusimicrobiales bacterium]
MNMGKRRMARINCFISLYLYDIGKIPSEEILNTYVQNTENIGIMKDPSTMDFYKNLFLITVEHIKEIDEIIRTASKKWDFDGIFPIDKAILRMATAEMVYLKNQVPIVIDEAVEISKMYSPNEEKGPDFINGVLDTIAKTNVLK